jgi:hypothetical protein
MRCPYLDEQGLCSIYPQRFSCCRNFPNRTKGMFCAETTRCVYDENGNLDCFNCKDKCCNHLDIPDDTPIWEVVRLLDISCNTCKEIYCGNSK